MFFDSIAAELEGKCASSAMWQKDPVEKKRVYIFRDKANAKIFKDTVANVDFSA